MPTIRRQGRRFLFLWCCRSAASAWLVPRRFGIRTSIVFRPLGRVPFGKRPKRNQKVSPLHPAFRFAKSTLGSSEFQRPALTGHPWPDNALATSMSLNP